MNSETAERDKRLALATGWREEVALWEGTIWFNPKGERDWPLFHADAAQSRALVAWLAENDERWYKFMIQLRLVISVPPILMDFEDHDGKLVPNTSRFTMRLMTAPLPAIAAAADAAISSIQQDNPNSI